MKPCRTVPRRAIHSALLVASFAALTAPAALRAQSRKPEDLRPGRLLVANRGALDPNFAGSVILLVDYSQNGAFGLILNHRTKVPVSDSLPQLRGSEAYEDPIYLGGPVRRDAVMALVKDEDEPHPPKHVVGDVYLISRKSELETELLSGARADQLRLYAGYAGWGAGQLENEMNRGDWFIFESTEAIIFDPHPENIWPKLIEQTELVTAKARR